MCMTFDAVSAADEAGVVFSGMGFQHRYTPLLTFEPNLTGSTPKWFMHMYNALCIIIIMLTHFVGATSKYSNVFQLEVKHKEEAALFQGQSKQASICIVNL